MRRRRKCRSLGGGGERESVGEERGSQEEEEGVGKVKGESLGNRGNREAGKGREKTRCKRRRKEHKHSLFPCPLELHDGCL